MGIVERPCAQAASADEAWMRKALALARRAEEAGEVPVGAILVKGDRIVGAGWNRPIGSSDPTAHAEIVALREAGQRLGNYRLVDTTMYVTLEPCLMCLGALVHARVKRLVFGAHDAKRGATGSAFKLANTDFLNHRPEFAGGILAEECGPLLSEFFLRKR
jgi:tRNA(adenine34) deaminase